MFDPVEFSTDVAGQLKMSIEDCANTGFVYLSYAKALTTIGAFLSGLIQVIQRAARTSSPPRFVDQQ